MWQIENPATVAMLHRVSANMMKQHWQVSRKVYARNFLPFAGAQSQIDLIGDLILAVYDRFGHLIHGSEAVVKDVLE